MNQREDEIICDSCHKDVEYTVHMDINLKDKDGKVIKTLSGEFCERCVIYRMGEIKGWADAKGIPLNINESELL